jgi:signal transduction histidine kinase
MKLSRRMFQKLRWKMTFPYIVIIPLVMFLIQVLVVLVAIIVIEQFFMPALILSVAQQDATQASPFFVHNGVPDQPGLTAWLQLPQSFVTYQTSIHAVVDKQGRVVASLGSAAPATNSMLSAKISAQEMIKLRQVLSGQISSQGVAYLKQDGRVIAIVPIGGNKNVVYGAIYEDTGADLAAQETHYWIVFYIPTFLSAGLFFAFFALIVGFLGSFVNVRNLTRRFNKLILAAQGWSRGNFTTFVQDPSQDEVGELGRHLNSMARQLQTLLHSRQQLAILEERNRLARDLHDSVKQQLFAVTLQVGTTRIQLKGDEETGERLIAVEDTLGHIQQELVSLISALRPVSLGTHSLAEALHELLERWSQQSNISATPQIDGDEDEDARVLPLALEEALYRIAQEALTNVQRHSEATRVQVWLRYERERVTLTCIDNGKGFDIENAQSHGIGLSSMRERIQAFGGEVRLASSPGNGTRVTVSCATVDVLV